MSLMKNLYKNSNNCLDNCKQLTLTTKKGTKIAKTFFSIKVCYSDTERESIELIYMGKERSAEPVFRKGDAEKSLTITPATVIKTKAQGNPSDDVRFYSIVTYPSVRRLSDDSEGTLPDYKWGFNSPDSMGTADYFNGALTTTNMNQVYTYLNSWGFELIGWNTTINFRFDFNKPNYWMYAVNQNPLSKQNMPSPFNPYQTYNMSYYTAAPYNESTLYSADFHGNVNCTHNNIANWTSEFYSGLTFNLKK